jgi:leucyl/phenylalanyl-tRNA--protein transferase
VNDSLFEKDLDRSQVIQDTVFRPSVNEMLRRYATGWYPCFLSEEPSGPVGWRKYTHRGIQWLDKIHVGSKQKRYVFSPKFEIRYNTAFSDVLIGCADLGRQGATWITPGLMENFNRLHRRGYAHSFECWQDGKLVGGAFGMQLGGMITVESMFHTVDHASKAAYGQTLFKLRDRGFKVVDVNNASEHFARFGAETVPQWKFEEMLRGALRERPSLDDAFPCRPLPLRVQIELPITRLITGMRRQIDRFTTPKRAA